jgi:hypothetical protein
MGGQESLDTSPELRVIADGSASAALKIVSVAETLGLPRSPSIISLSLYLM